MRRRSKLLLAAGLIGLLAIFLFRSDPHDPLYHGKRLTAWLADLTSSSQGGRAEARAAVQALGTNALPKLLELFQKEETALQLRARLLLQKQKLLKLRLVSPEEWRQCALIAFMELGPVADPAMHQLAALLDDPLAQPYAMSALRKLSDAVIPIMVATLRNVQANPGLRADAALELGYRHVDVHGTVDALIWALEDSDMQVCARAIYALERFPDEKDRVVPALIRKLKDNPNVQGMAIQTLRRLGPNAVEAVPPLKELMQQGLVGAGYALAEISPEEARKLGITIPPKFE